MIQKFINELKIDCKERNYCRLSTQPSATHSAHVVSSYINRPLRRQHILFEAYALYSLCKLSLKFLQRLFRLHHFNYWMHIKVHFGKFTAPVLFHNPKTEFFIKTYRIRLESTVRYLQPIISETDIAKPIAASTRNLPMPFLSDFLSTASLAILILGYL